MEAIQKIVSRQAELNEKKKKYEEEKANQEANAQVVHMPDVCVQRTKWTDTFVLLLFCHSPGFRMAPRNKKCLSCRYRDIRSSFFFTFRFLQADIVASWGPGGNWGGNHDDSESW